MEPGARRVKLVRRRCVLFPDERRREPGTDHRGERPARGRSSSIRCTFTRMSDRGITLVTLADERYALPLAVLGRSLADHLRAPEPATLYVVDGGLAPDTKRHLLDSWD